MVAFVCVCVCTCLLSCPLDRVCVYTYVLVLFGFSFPIQSIKCDFFYATADHKRTLTQTTRPQKMGIWYGVQRDEWQMVIVIGKHEFVKMNKANIKWIWVRHITHRNLTSFNWHVSVCEDVIGFAHAHTHGRVYSIRQTLHHISEIYWSEKINQLCTVCGCVWANK